MFGRAYLHTMRIVIVISGDNEKRPFLLLSFVVITINVTKVLLLALLLISVINTPVSSIAINNGNIRSLLLLTTKIY